MVSALVVAAVKYGLLALLWLFVLAAIRTVRTDLFGSRAQQPVAGVSAAAPARPAGGRRSSARKLVVTEGALAGTTVTLNGSPVTLGRAHDSTLVLTDDYASTHHARLVPGEDAWLVEDLGSTNGTYLNRRRVQAPVAMQRGDRLQVGNTVMELV